MNKLSEAIEQAKQDCLITGSSEIKLNHDIKICAEWSTWEEDENYDVIEIIIFDNNVIKIVYQLEETITESE